MPSNIQLFEKYNTNPVFIETGSYAGEGIRNAIFAGYKNIHSIELAEKYYQFCKSYFKYIDFVHLYEGDSVTILSCILDKINTSITFWLDAHYSGGDTDFKDTLSPLMRELEIIKTHPIKTHTIIIDDLREWHSDYPAIKFGTDEIKNKILEINPNYIFSMADGFIPEDILVAETKSQKPINIVVFSKDRAMQLDLFIRSFNHLVKDYYNYDIQVLYTYSDTKFEAGYNKLINKNNFNVRFKKEIDFKSDLLGLVNSGNPYTVFFVDDNVFKNPFDFYDKQMDVFNWDETILCRSLRLHKNLNYCYPARKPMKPPVFVENVFSWRGQTGCYGYPLSVDGNIYRTKDIMPYLTNLQYVNPNSLEGEMANAYVQTPNMICYDKSVIVNNPLNKVQTNNPNICGNISAEFLNDKFLEGFIISLDNFVGIENTACHQEITPIFINESNSN
jgi:hypothetical protein